MANNVRDRATEAVEDTGPEAPKKSFVDQQSLPPGDLSSDSEDDIVLDLTKDTNAKAAPVAASAPASGTEAATTAAAKKSGLDINAVGQHKGQDIYHFDVANAEDKPWEKPGADITDYFNYGFNEKTWQEYCAKQIKLREEQQQRRQINVGGGGWTLAMEMRMAHDQVFDSSNQGASESGLPIPNLSQPGGMGSRMAMGPMPGMMPQFMPNVPMPMGEHNEGSEDDGPNQQFGMRPMFNMNMGPMNFGGPMQGNPMRPFPQNKGFPNRPPGGNFGGNQPLPPPPGAKGMGPGPPGQRGSDSGHAGPESGGMRGQGLGRGRGTFNRPRGGYHDHGGPGPRMPVRPNFSPLGGTNGPRPPPPSASPSSARVGQDQGPPQDGEGSGSHQSPPHRFDRPSHSPHHDSRRDDSRSRRRHQSPPSDHDDAPKRRDRMDGHHRHDSRPSRRSRGSPHPDEPQDRSSYEGRRRRDRSRSPARQNSGRSSRRNR
ncbi:cleavage polyadenylation factor subunit fip1 [Dimargaris xerosporica]|nr:cleavage polyadenylation factor subunit fip1 [Dimargaris xerosporica]